MAPQYLEKPGRPKLAYHYTPAQGKGANLPAVMFLGGFRSDMAGTKATYLEDQCRSRGQAYMRFDYSGHGVSGGKFEDGTIGAWLADALAVFDLITTRPVILVGSSMGGWISLLMGRARPRDICGIIGIAAAPDFTRGLYQSFDESQKAELAEKGFLAFANEYSPDPYVFTRALIEDGEKHCLLDQDIDLPMPVRLIQGMKDPDVPWQTAFRIKNAVQGEVTVFTVEQGDHRLSRPDDLALIDVQVRALSGF